MVTVGWKMEVITDTKRSSPMQRWAFVAIQAVLSPTERLIAVSYCIVRNALRIVTVPVNVRRLHGHCTKERRCVAVGEAAEDWKFRASFVGSDQSWSAPCF